MFLALNRTEMLLDCYFSSLELKLDFYALISQDQKPFINFKRVVTIPLLFIERSFPLIQSVDK